MLYDNTGTPTKMCFIAWIWFISGPERATARKFHIFCSLAKVGNDTVPFPLREQVWVAGRGTVNDLTEMRRRWQALPSKPPSRFSRCFILFRPMSADPSNVTTKMFFISNFQLNKILLFGSQMCLLAE